MSYMLLYMTNSPVTTYANRSSLFLDRIRVRSGIPPSWMRLHTRNNRIGINLGSNAHL